MRKLGLILIFVTHCSPGANKECPSGEIYNNFFSSCCNEGLCDEGHYFNCSKCTPCGDNRFKNQKNQDTLCEEFTSCSEGEVESFPGNATHDRVCDKARDADPPSSTLANFNVTVLKHPNSTLTYLGMGSGILAGIIFVLCLVTAFIIHRKKKKCKRLLSCDPEREEGNVLNGLIGSQSLLNNEIKAPLDLGSTEYESVLTNGTEVINTSQSDERFKKAKENIKQNMAALRTDMISNHGLFWAALKEGSNSTYSYSDQQDLIRDPPPRRNGKLLDKAIRSREHLKSLIYALKVSGQPHLAELIGYVSEDKDQSPENWRQFSTIPENLRNNRVYILENLSTRYDFWSYLRQGNAYTEEDEEICQKLGTEALAIDYLIETLLRGDKQKLENFGKALKENGYDYLYTSIFGLIVPEEETSKTPQEKTSRTPPGGNQQSPHRSLRPPVLPYSSVSSSSRKELSSLS